VREFFISNAQYWIEEFHLDGLRLDATQQIFDSSPEHLIAAVARAVRQAGGGRSTYLVAENESQHTRLVRAPEAGGYGLDALWNDDFHHSAVVAATGRNEAYYTDYKGAPQEFISAAKQGYLYQGQWYTWQEQRRGTPGLDLSPCNFVTFIDNHDQVANSLRGHRLDRQTTPGRYKALTALLLLGPGTPMLFQGQEFAASTPFYYFADHNAELAKLVAKGRREFMHQFKSIAHAEAEEAAGGEREPGPHAECRLLPDPESERTFGRCVLDFSERQTHRGIYAMHRELLRLRREDPVFSRQDRGRVDGAVLGNEAFVLRFFGDRGDDRLLIVNLGIDLRLSPMPEPLLAPPLGCRWRVIFSTEAVCYGGHGTPPPEQEDAWWLPGHAAVALVPEPREE